MLCGCSKLWSSLFINMSPSMEAGSPLLPTTPSPPVPELLSPRYCRNWLGPWRTNHVPPHCPIINLGSVPLVLYICLSWVRIVCVALPCLLTWEKNHPLNSQASFLRQILHLFYFLFTSTEYLSQYLDSPGSAKLHLGLQSQAEFFMSLIPNMPELSHWMRSWPGHEQGELLYPLG